MRIKNTIPFPSTLRLAAEFGENIKFARLRRKLSSMIVAERAGISRSTLIAVERGLPSVAMGTYLQVLFVLGLEKDFLLVGKDDILGRKLQDLGLISKKRAPKRKTPDEIK